MAATEYVILVDENDQEIGQAEKLIAHKKNLLHRAFSVFILRNRHQDHEVLLQQRALHKYHSPGLWTNTCCSHPRAGESLIAAGKRRLKEELGFSAALQNIGWFHYNAHFNTGLAENEIDHVLIGTLPVEENIIPNPQEVHAYRWVPLTQLQQELVTSPHLFTAWFKQALSLVTGYLSHTTLLSA